MSKTTDRSAIPALDIDILVRALRQQRWTALAFLVAVVSATLVVSLLITPTYEAVALILLMPRAGQEVDVSEVVAYDEAGYMERRDQARTQMQVILSRNVREEVLRRYAAEGYTDLPASAEGAGILRESMSVSPREDTQLVEIRVKHTDPERAAVLANLTAAVYKETNLEDRTAAARETRVWLEGQTSGFRGDLAAATQALLQFKSDNNLIDVDEKVDDIAQRMDALQRALGDATTETALLESQLTEHEKLLWNGKVSVLAESFDSPTLDAMSRQRGEVATEAASILARYGEKHPEHQRAVDHLTRMDELLRAEVKNNVDAERARVRILQQQIERLNADLTAVKGEMLEKQRLQDQYLTLKMEEERLRRMYDSLGERGAEVELQARTRLGNVRIVDEALPPGRPINPNLPLNLLVSLLVGLGGGVGLALLRYRLDDRLRTPADIEAHLDAPLLGVVPRLPASVPAERRALYTLEATTSPVAGALRDIRALLNAVPMSSDPHRLVIATHQRFLVTSSEPGEGRSQLAVGLAVAFARLGVTTLLVDASLPDPRLHSVLGIDRSPGLVDALLGDQDPLELVEVTEIADLHLLPGGVTQEGQAELLASPRVAAALTRLGGRYPVVIIDAPASMHIADVQSLTRGAEVVMVVRHGQIRAGQAVRTLERLRQAGASVRGVVLNDAPTEDGAMPYGLHAVERPSALAGR